MIARLFFSFLLAGFLALSGPLSGAAQENSVVPELPIPGYGAPDLRPPKPALGAVTRIRFLTATDFPPFNFIDSNNKLVGFNVDIAREICLFMEIECSIIAEEWAVLPARLDSGRGEAVIASIAMTPQTRTRYDFSMRYHFSPARFIGRTATEERQVTPEGLTGIKVGVTGNTAHAAYLAAFFDAAMVTEFADRGSARQALVDGEIDYLFDDGVSLMFWLNGTASAGCCKFVGGGFLESRYFGEGVGIMVAKGNDDVRQVLDYGLFHLFESGKYLEIYLRYFPMNFY